MRRNHTLVVLLFTITLTAQEAPLPVVTARNTTDAPEVMLIATAVEPIREYHGPTLAEAARANDYVSFDALYREARARGESVAQYETLHELWTYSVTDPIGAWYGEEMYERLARAYPGFAQFIDEQSVVDSRGNVFYPTAETREYVLARALEGRAPRVLLADTPRRESPMSTTIDEPAPVVEARATTRPPRRRFQKADATVAPAIVNEAPAKPAAVPQPAPVAIAQAAPAPVAEEPIEASTPQPVIAQQQASAQPAVVQAGLIQPQKSETSAASRGMLLIVMGLIGIGLLAVMFRTPKEALATTSILDVPPPASKTTDVKPVAPVEPLKRPEGQQRGKHRANGSRG